MRVATMARAFTIGLMSTVALADSGVVTYPLPRFRMLINMNTNDIELDELLAPLSQLTGQHMISVFDKILKSDAGGSIPGGEESIDSIELSLGLQRVDHFTALTSSWRSVLQANFEGTAKFNRHDETTSLVTDELILGMTKFAFKNTMQIDRLMQRFGGDPLLKNVKDFEVVIAEGDDEAAQDQDETGTNNLIETMTGGGLALLFLTFSAVLALSLAGFCVYRCFARKTHTVTETESSVTSEHKAEKSTDVDSMSTEEEMVTSSSDEEEAEEPSSHLAEWGSWALAVARPPPLQSRKRKPRKTTRVTTTQKSSPMTPTLNVIQEEEMDEARETSSLVEV